MSSNRKQGKCTRCKVVFRWEGKPLLRDACCPICEVPLSQTSYLSRLPGYDRRPLDRPVAA